MKGKALPITILVVLFVGLIILNYFAPKKVVWDDTYESYNTQPYDTYVLRETLPDIFSAGVDETRQTIYEMAEGEQGAENLFVLTRGFRSTEVEADVLLEWIRAGGNALLVAEYFPYSLLERLDLSSEDDSWKLGPAKHGIEAWKEESMLIRWVQGDSVHFYLPIYHAPAFFERKDLSNGKQEKNAKLKYTVLAENGDGHPVIISIKEGTGTLVLSTLPKAFTNYFLLKGESAPLAARHFAHMNLDAPLVWNEYYVRGRDEPDSPLRFIASQSSLRWGYYVFMGSIFLFLLFQGKRKQRIIPILKPPRNDTLDFAKTIGRLYYERRNHTDLTKKKILFFSDYVRNEYRITFTEFDEPSAIKLAHKAGKDEDKTIQLVKRLGILQKRGNISAEELRILNNDLEEFYAR